MLKSMRGAAGSWVVKGFIALLVLSFAAWGVGDIFVSRHSGAIALVGDREITANRFAMALQNQMAGVERQIGRRLTIPEARSFGLDQAALMGVARQEAMFAEAEELGVSASDIEVKLSIALNPAFHNALGEFDANQYRQTVEFSRITPAQYEEGQRRSLASAAVVNFAATGYALPAVMAERLHNFNNETRRVHYVTLDREAADEVASPDDDALQAHLAAHADAFSSPEFRKARYVLASVDALSKQMAATEQEALEIYEVRKSFYNTPETRRLRRIVYKSAEEAEAAKARLAEGVSFSDLAEEKGLSSRDTLLGYSSAGDFDPEIASAAFAEAEPGVIGPVETAFGPALIEIDAITPGESRSFDDVRDELLDTVRHDKALEEIVRIQTEIGDFVAGGADLELIAKNMGLELAETPVLDASGASPEGAVTGAASDRVFLSAMFAAEEGKVTQPISLSDESVVVLSVSEIVPPALRPLDEVRGAVTESLEAERIAEALAKAAEDIVARVSEGKLLAAEADAFGKTLSTSDKLKRSDKTADLPADLVESLFALDVGGAAWAARDGGARVVIAQVFEVEAPQGEESDAEKTALAARINSLAQGDIQELLTRAAVDARGVQVNKSALEETLGNIGGNTR